MGLVATWLKGIGLGYAVPSFVAAGIVTPSALAELEAMHFEALGVRDANDRRKLFYLVQRIKLAVDHKDDSIHEVDSVLAETIGQRVVLDPSSAVEEDSEMRPSAVSNQDDSQTKENRLFNGRNATTNAALVRRQRESVGNPQGSDPYPDEEEFLHEKVDDDEESELGLDSGASADDEASSVPDTTVDVTSLRRSQRIQEKRQGLDNTTAAAARRNTSLMQPKKTRRGELARAKSESIPPGSESDSGDPVKHAGPKRQSSVPKPKTRRSESARTLARPVSFRTGKELSTIPADTVAPMSPLVNISTRQLALDLDIPVPDMKGTKNGRHSVGATPLNPKLEWEVQSSTESNSDSRRSSITQKPADYGNGSEPKIRGARREADGWKAQIAQLREDAQAEHELFGEDADFQQEEENDDMRIRVVVRKRPMSKSESASSSDLDIVQVLDCSSYGRVLVYQPKTRVDLTREIEVVPFAFDNVFDEHSTNLQIYERTIRCIIPPLFEGQWASIFAYGQTGSGKTFTMMGSNSTGMQAGSCKRDTRNLGLYHMAALDLFQAIRTPGFENFCIFLSFFEIYGGKLYDLLNHKEQIKCLENNKGKVCFPGLTEHPVHNPDQLITLIENGTSNRATGTTSRNADSSRSHAVLQLHIRNSSRGEGKEHSRLTFIDLAGSERGSDTSTACRTTRLEGAEINTSLLALKEVIRALAKGSSVSHVPFRGSKLTQVLKESFVGKNCRSVMIACIAPNSFNCEPTLNSLRYSDRVKERDPKTGETSVEQGSVRGSGVATIKRSQSELSALELSSDHSAVLDDLLASPRNGDSATGDVDESTQDETEVIEEPCDSATITGELIAMHKAAMSDMLEMIKDEMTLVNEADSCGDGLHSYITQINTVHERQLTMIAALREQLLLYHTARANDSSGAVRQIPSEDSFEDLRD